MGFHYSEDGEERSSRSSERVDNARWKQIKRVFSSKPVINVGSWRRIRHQIDFLCRWLLQLKLASPVNRLQLFVSHFAIDEPPDIQFPARCSHVDAEHDFANSLFVRIKTNSDIQIESGAKDLQEDLQFYYTYPSTHSSKSCCKSIRLFLLFLPLWFFCSLFLLQIYTETWLQIYSKLLSIALRLAQIRSYPKHKKLLSLSLSLSRSALSARRWMNFNRDD
jgi:hypothetical protein